MSMQDDGTDRLRHIVQIRGDNKEEAARRYAAQSRERLRKNMETKIRTTMIGSLSIIESKIGFLWGQGKSRGQLTEQEEEMDRIKDEMRTEILNNGNNQLRAAVAEINQYDVTWNKHQYNLGNQ